MNTTALQSWERDYLRTLTKLVEWADLGRWKGNRTGVRTVGGFGKQLEVELVSGRLPVMISKTVHVKSVVAELLWFLQGETNLAFLHQNGCTIWDEWSRNGELGPVYGKQWRSWHGVKGGLIDQLAKLIEDLHHRPQSRRMVVSAWNPDDLPDEGLSPQENVSMDLQALAPCHMLFQCYVETMSLDRRLEHAEHHGVPAELVSRLAYKPLRDDADKVLDTYGVPRRGLSLRVDQRSADWFLGVPFNILSYALLTHLLCQVVPDMAPDRLIMQFGDYHLYENQQEAALEHLSRFIALDRNPAQLSPVVQEPPRPLFYPSVKFHRTDEWSDLSVVQMEDIEVTNYVPWGRILAPVAV